MAMNSAQQTAFGGLNRLPGAMDGEITEMMNLRSDMFPCLASAPSRYLCRTATKLNGIFAKEKLAWVDGTNFYYDDPTAASPSSFGIVVDSKKTFASLGNFLLIFPDKKYFITNWQSGNTYPQFGDLEASFGPAALTFQNGTYDDYPANANTLVTSTPDGFPFRVGDAVIISGCTIHPANNKTPIIREISTDKKTLRFYENVFELNERYTVVDEDLEAGTYYWKDQYNNARSFTLDADLPVDDYLVWDGTYLKINGSTTISVTEIADGTELFFLLDAVTESAVTLARKVPDMDYFCEGQNRLWGVKGKSVYACKLGDPFNWNVYDGLDTDAFSVDTGTKGDFTAAINYGGLPTLFKPEIIHKVYGTKPSNFDVVSSAFTGVAAGSGKSPAVVGNIMFYLSEGGVVQYLGSVPSLIDRVLNLRLTNGIGGADERKYYLSAEDQAGKRRLFVYTAEMQFWHEEDDPGIWDIVNLGGDVYFAVGNKIIRERSNSFSGQEWSFETADYTNAYFGRKITGPYFIIRYFLEDKAEMKVYLSADGGDWQELTTIAGEGKKKSVRFGTIPVRCDHYRLKFTGTGEFLLFSLAHNWEAGTTK